MEAGSLLAALTPYFNVAVGYQAWIIGLGALAASVVLGLWFVKGKGTRSLVRRFIFAITLITLGLAGVGVAQGIEVIGNLFT